jgi:hypothetical protein
MSREENYDLYFPAVAYYDGQGFMVPRARNIDSALDLNDGKVCVHRRRRPSSTSPTIGAGTADVSSLAK